MIGYAIVVAAGRGRRMGGETPKQYLDLGGATILQRTLEAVSAAGDVRGVVLVVPHGDVVYCKDEIVDKAALAKVRRVVAGGPSRQESVAHGLAAIEKLGETPDVVAIHDGVRPFVDPAIVDKALRTALHFGGALAASPVVETIKEVTDDGFVRCTPDRRCLFRAHTPQAFAWFTLLDAYRRAANDDFTGAVDDCQLVERVGGRIIIVDDGDRNIKITTPTDLVFARALWKDLHGK